MRPPRSPESGEIVGADDVAARLDACSVVLVRAHACMQSTVICPPSRWLVREERDERISKRSERDGEPDEEVGRR